MTTTIPIDDCHPRITTKHRLAAGPGGGRVVFWTAMRRTNPGPPFVCVYGSGGFENGRTWPDPEI